MKCARDMDPWYTKKTWAEISKSALVNNLAVIRSHISDPGVRVAPVVKANAYGHCTEIVVPLLEEAGVDYLFVATLDEAIALRESGTLSAIMVFGTTRSEFTPYLKRYRLAQSLVTAGEVAEFSRQSEKTGGPPLEVHIKLDTGMTRLGLKADEKHREKTVQVVLAAACEPALKVTGIYSHLATADCDPDYAKLQRTRFADTVGEAESRGFPRVIRHLAASSAIPLGPGYHFDLVRPGIVLYGGRAGPDKEAWHGLKPVMTVKSVIEQVEDVDAGTPVSYGGTWKAPVDSVLAVVNMGYADGLPRLLSNRGSFFHKGRELPIRGRVCMDRCMVDVTGLDDIKAGDQVTFFGQDEWVRKDASEITDLYGTIDYELFCGISERVPRIGID